MGTIREQGAMKISGRHTSLPSELKKPVRRAFPKEAKVIMTDIVSCRHKYPVGTLRVVDQAEKSVKVRAYFGSGVVNLFVKFPSEEIKQVTLKQMDS